MKNLLFVFFICVIVCKSNGSTAPKIACFECTEQPGDSWCNGPNEANLKTCASGEVCFTELNVTMLTKGCRNASLCFGTDNKQKYDKVTGKFYGRQCCTTNECNKKTRWTDTPEDILRRSMGLKTEDQTLPAAISTVMSLQIAYAVLYMIVIGYITFTYFTQCHNVQASKRHGNSPANKVSPPPDQYQTSSMN